MNVYTVHMRRHGLDQDSDIVLVKEGFSWPAFLFTVLWALYNRLWVVAAIVLLAFVSLELVARYLGISEAVLMVAEVGLSVLVGFLAHDCRRESLTRAGFENLDVVIADNQTSAEQRYFDRNPAMADVLRLGH